MNDNGSAISFPFVINTKKRIIQKIERSTGTMEKRQSIRAAVVHQYGYNTYWVGKWHNTPNGDTEGPFDRWPVGEMMGFDRFYGFLGGDSNQWYPSLVWDHHPHQLNG
jgi:arylsulfatase A-like enzyme